MKRLSFFLITLIALIFCPAIRAGVKYVAVVETDIDAASGASAAMTPAEVRLITGELRREAVNNLSRDKYNVMTSETVMAQGSAKLEECAEENCVIALGSKIGADYIVRGTISKFQTLFTLTVDIYETEDGNLVASSDPVRSENIRGLLENAGPVCAAMYKKFANQNPTPATPAPPPPTAAYTVAVVVNPAKGGYVVRSLHKADYNAGEALTLTAISYNGYVFTGWSGAVTDTINPVRITVDANKELFANFQRMPKPKPAPKPVREKPQSYAADAETRSDGLEMLERKPMTGFSVGFGGDFFSMEDAYLQLGVVHSRPLSLYKDAVSLNAEGNVWIGGGAAANFLDGVLFGLNVPVTALFYLSVFSLEAGAHGDLVFGDGEAVFNFGAVAGAGIGFNKKRSRRYYYRYSGGYNYGTHVIGMRWLF